MTEFTIYTLLCKDPRIKWYTPRLTRGVFHQSNSNAVLIASYCCREEIAYLSDPGWRDHWRFADVHRTLPQIRL
jgi:hypothetical protein